MKIEKVALWSDGCEVLGLEWNVKMSDRLC